MMINKKNEKYDTSKKRIHCCVPMQQEIEDQRVFIGYNPKFREYYINTIDSSVIRQIYRCPWCGKELPKSLRNEWFDVLENEYDLDDPWGNEQEKLVPEEFTSDKWWKSHNL